MCICTARPSWWRICIGLALGTGVSSWFAGLVHYWPALCSRPLDPRQIRAGALLFLIGSNLTILPGFVQGKRGMIRGAYTYPDEMRALEVLATVARGSSPWGSCSPITRWYRPRGVGDAGAF